VGLGVSGIVIAAIISSRSALSVTGDGIDQTTVEAADANIRQLARSIFSNNVFAFEVTSVLLLVAVIGTVLMARRIKLREAGK
jgi:NADH-quinone oxidoreductase subunit J